MVTNTTPTAPSTATRSVTRAAATAPVIQPTVQDPAPAFLNNAFTPAPTVAPEVTMEPNQPPNQAPADKEVPSAPITLAPTTPNVIAQAETPLALHVPPVVPATTTVTAPETNETTPASTVADPDYFELFSDEDEEVVGELIVTSSDDGDDDDYKSDMELEEGQDPKFVLNYWDGSPPELTGTVAHFFNKQPVLTQFTQIETLIKASAHTSPTFALGDINDTNTLFLVVTGSNRKLKVIYNVTNADQHDFFKDTVIENSLLALKGEYIPGVQIPSALVLPKAALIACSVKVPDRDTFA